MGAAYERRMKDLKNNSFSDRAKTSAEAKAALLAKMKAKPAVQATDFVSRDERKRQELDAVRAARAAAKEEARQAQETKAAVAAAVVAADQESEDARRRAERKERKAAAKAEARAKREAKAAMRRN